MCAIAAPAAQAWMASSAICLGVTGTAEFVRKASIVEPVTAQVMMTLFSMTLLDGTTRRHPRGSLRAPLRACHIAALLLEHYLIIAPVLYIDVDVIAKGKGAGATIAQ
jgi:hypothetical protein